MFWNIYHVRFRESFTYVQGYLVCKCQKIWHAMKYMQMA